MPLPDIFWFLTDSICGYPRKDKFSLLKTYQQLAAAGEGFFFEEALSLFPSTFGAVYSMLTGRFPCYTICDYAPRPEPWHRRSWERNYLRLLSQAGYRVFSLVCYEVGHRWMATVSEALVDPGSFAGGNQLDARELGDRLRAFLKEDPPSPLLVFVHFRAGDRGVDRELSRLISFLRAQGRWEEALVLICSDHGYRTFLETRNPLHFDDVHVASLRPAVFLKLPARWRGRFPPRRVRERIYTIDLWETILDLLGVSCGFEREAHSFKAALQGPSASPCRLVRGDAYFAFQPVRRSFVVAGPYKLNLSARGHQLVRLEGHQEEPWPEPARARELLAFFHQTHQRQEALMREQVRAAFDHSFLAHLSGQRILLPRAQFPPLLVNTLAELLRHHGNTVIQDLQGAGGRAFDLGILVFNRLTGYGLARLKKELKRRGIKVQKFLYINTQLQLVSLKEGYGAFFWRELRRRRSLLWKRPAGTLLWLFYFPFFFNWHLRPYYRP